MISGNSMYPVSQGVRVSGSSFGGGQTSSGANFTSVAGQYNPLGVQAKGQSTYQKPSYIDPSASINNTLAQGDAMGDYRANVKSLDRGGFSRGKGSQYAAGLAGVKAVSEARNRAANTQMETDQANSQIRQDFQYGQEMEAQKYAMAAHDLDQSNWSVFQANQQALARIRAAQQSGQLQIINAAV